MLLFRALKSTGQIVKVSIGTYIPVVFIASLDGSLMMKLYNIDEAMGLVRNLTELEKLLINREDEEISS